MAKKDLPVTSSRQLALMYFVLLAINSFVIYVANMFFPENVVIGNMSLTSGWAIFLSMSMLSLIGILTVPLFEYVQEMRGSALEMPHWIGGYLVVNFVGIWLITRFAENFGLGISAWWVGLVLAAIMDFLQGVGMQLVYKVD